MPRRTAKWGSPDSSSIGAAKPQEAHRGNPGASTSRSASATRPRDISLTTNKLQRYVDVWLAKNPASTSCFRSTRKTWKSGNYTTIIRDPGKDSVVNNQLGINGGYFKRNAFAVVLLLLAFAVWSVSGARIQAAEAASGKELATQKVVIPAKNWDAPFEPVPTLYGSYSSFVRKGDTYEVFNNTIGDGPDDGIVRFTGSSPVEFGQPARRHSASDHQRRAGQGRQAVVQAPLHPAVHRLGSEGWVLRRGARVRRLSAER